MTGLGVDHWHFSSSGQELIITWDHLARAFLVADLIAAI